MGVESFIRNGIRPSLIPVIIKYFQGKRMRVKWHGLQKRKKSEDVKKTKTMIFNFSKKNQFTKKIKCVEYRYRYGKNKPHH